MIKFVYMVRGGIAKEMAESLEDLIKEAGVQDQLFLIDVKTHSFEMLGEEQAVGTFTRRFLGKHGLSLIISEMHSSINVVYGAFGKIMDGQLMNRQNDLAKKMF